MTKVLDVKAAKPEVLERIKSMVAALDNDTHTVVLLVRNSNNRGFLCSLGDDEDVFELMNRMATALHNKESVPVTPTQ